MSQLTKREEIALAIFTAREARPQPEISYTYGTEYAILIAFRNADDFISASAMEHTSREERILSIRQEIKRKASGGKF